MGGEEEEEGRKEEEKKKKTKGFEGSEGDGQLRAVPQILHWHEPD